MKILVAEDNAVTRRLLQRVLEKLGHQVVTAENGQAAWDQFQNEVVPIVISDWMMPQMDGLQLCRRIRAEALQQYVYIVVLTAKDQKEDLVEVFRAGADDYITKPFDPEELRASLTKCERILNLEARYRSLENTLIESRNKLRIVFDSMHEEIVAVDRAINIVSANKAFLKGIEADFDGVIDAPLFSADIPSPAWRSDSLRRLIQDVFATQVPQQILAEVTGPDQEPAYKLIDGLPVTDDTGSVFQVVLVCKDITDDRRKTRKIQNLNKELKASADHIQKKNSELEIALRQLKETQAQMLQTEKMASIGQLAAGVAHEINNPTGYVSSNLKTLSKYQRSIDGLLDRYEKLKAEICQAAAQNGIPQGVRQHLERIEAFEDAVKLEFLKSDIHALIEESCEGTERIKKIVLDLKEFAHPGQKQKKPANLNKGLESTLNVVWNEFKHKARVLKDFGELPEVSCFPQQLNQVFMNVLMNAAQAVSENGEIRIQTRHEDRCIKVVIQDNGTGIEEKNLLRIFDPFFTTKDVGEGTGLGLNIAYNIVKKHNGSISVESTVGEGTTFTVKIPVV